MITLAIILLLLGVLFIAVCLGATILLDPIIAILVIAIIIKLVTKLFKKKNK